jgi:hypothetical protein
MGSSSHGKGFTRRIRVEVSPDRFNPESEHRGELLMTEDAETLSAERPTTSRWIGMIATWLSILSALIYFCSSYGIKNHIRFLLESLGKAAGAQ